MEFLDRVVRELCPELSDQAAETGLMVINDATEPEEVSKAELRHFVYICA